MDFSTVRTQTSGIYDLAHILSWRDKGIYHCSGSPACWHCSYEVYDLTHILSWCDMGSITVLVHQLAGTAHMRSMT